MAPLEWNKYANKAFKDLKQSYRDVMFYKLKARKKMLYYELRCLEQELHPTDFVKSRQKKLIQEYRDYRVRTKQNERVIYNQQLKKLHKQLELEKKLEQNNQEPLGIQDQQEQLELLELLIMEYSSLINS